MPTLRNTVPLAWLTRATLPVLPNLGAQTASPGWSRDRHSFSLASSALRFSRSASLALELLALPVGLVLPGQGLGPGLLRLLAELLELGQLAGLPLPPLRRTCGPA